MVRSFSICLLVASALTASIGSASMASAAEPCAATTAEQNVELVKNHIQAMVAHDMDAAGNLLHEDLSHNLSRRGIDTGEVSAGELAKRTPEDVTVHDIFGSGDKVAVRFSFPVEASAVEGSGADSASQTNAIAIARLECGKIREVWIEQDDLGLVLAMGMTVAAPE